MRRLIVSLFLAAPLLASCTAVAPEEVLSVAAAPDPTVIPAPETAYVAPEYTGPRLPGTWGIYVDADKAPTSYRAGNAACGDRVYELPADAVIRDAVMETSAHAFNSTRALAAPPRHGGNGLTWSLLVRLVQADGSLVWEDTSTRPMARADIKAEITVLDSRGDTIRKMTESATAMSDYGAGCEGGETLMTHAYKRASHRLVSRIVPEIGTN